MFYIIIIILYLHNPTPQTYWTYRLQSTDQTQALRIRGAFFCQSGAMGSCCLRLVSAAGGCPQLAEAFAF